MILIFLKGWFLTVTYLSRSTKNFDAIVSIFQINFSRDLSEIGKSIIRRLKIASFICQYETGHTLLLKVG